MCVCVVVGGGGGSLSPPRLNIFTVGNMGVMICLGRGGLRSLSASSLFYYLILFILFIYLFIFFFYLFIFFGGTK